MAFVGKKVYGQSKQEGCVFCGSNARFENPQGFTVCAEHKTKEMEAMRCACGQWLDIKKSKWGAFFVCGACGPVSLKKASEIKSGLSDDGFKLNKKFREQEESHNEKVLFDKRKKMKYQEDVIYTLSELEAMWQD